VNDGTMRLNEALDQLTASGNWAAITLRGKALRDNHSGDQLVAAPRPSPHIVVGLVSAACSSERQSDASEHSKPPVGRTVI